MNYYEKFKYSLPSFDDGGILEKFLTLVNKKVEIFVKICSNQNMTKKFALIFIFLLVGGAIFPLWALDSDGQTNEGYDPIAGTVEEALEQLDDSSQCPKGGNREQGVCCKNGFEYSESEGDYTIYSGICKCPPGGARKGSECCNNENLAFNYFTQKYDVVRGSDCGCPKDEDGKEILPNKKGFCCKGDLAYDSDEKKYVLPFWSGCGCPVGKYGEEPQYKEGNVCCQNGLSWGYDSDGIHQGIGYYQLDPQHCGCPKDKEGNEVLPDENGHCCQDGLGYTSRSDSYTQIKAYCGCPAGTHPSEKDDSICCCDDGTIYGIPHDMTVPRMEAAGCGNHAWGLCGGDYCPPVEQFPGHFTSGHQRETEEGTFCCWGPYAYNLLSGLYDAPEPMICGCPAGEDGSAGRGVDDETCCDGIKIYNWTAKAYILSDDKCCPDGGKMGWDSETCCKDKKAYNWMTGKYEGSENKYCVCASKDQELTNGYCCPIGYVWIDENTSNEADEEDDD